MQHGSSVRARRHATCGDRVGAASDRLQVPPVDLGQVQREPHPDAASAGPGAPHRFVAVAAVGAREREDQSACVGSPHAAEPPWSPPSMACRRWVRRRVSRTSPRTTGPTFPVRSWIRVVATERTCWHCAEEGSPRRLSLSGSMITSVLLWRSVRVNGTTWTTFGPPLSTRCAVTTMAGRRGPASLPDGVPGSRATTSPCVSIKPRRLFVVELSREVSRHGDRLAAEMCGAARRRRRCVRPRAGPRARGHRRPTNRTVHPRSVGFEDGLDSAQVRRPGFSLTEPPAGASWAGGRRRGGRES